jgi:septum site-determining protein MinC
VSGVARQRSSMRLRGRSYMAFALAPEPPVAEWLAELDDWLRTSAGFFAGRPVVLDLAAVKLTSSAVAHLISELADRNIRIMGLEGADADKLGPGLPPLMPGGRETAVEDTRAQHNAAVAAATPVVPAVPEPASLLVQSPVRSGQSVFFPNGDVTIVGSVGSGAEVVAGGSIHVYGTLRGRALAGTSGNRQARIFCLRMEAELLAIDGFYRTADDLGARRPGPVQAWLDGEALMIAGLD